MDGKSSAALQYAVMHFGQPACPAVGIAHGRCEALGRTVAALPRTPRFDTELVPRCDAPDEAVFRAIFWAATICHATKGAFRGSQRGRRIKGWDYLLHAMLDATERQSALLTPQRVAAIDASDLLDLLERPRFCREVRLDDADRRAEMLRDAAAWLLKEFDGSVGEVLARAGHRVDGMNGVYACLSGAPGFNDVHRKKSSVLIAALHHSGRVTFSGLESFVPMADYHVMRLMLRTRCIVIEDADLADRLARRAPVMQVEEDAVRQATIAACRLAAELGQVSIIDLNVLLWAHARSCCRTLPLCTSREPEGDSFFRLVSVRDPRVCVFESWCPGAARGALRALWEPELATEFY